MVLKHNKRSFTDDETCQHVSKYVRLLDFGPQLITSAEISSYSCTSEGYPVSDGKDFLGVQREASAGVNNNHSLSVVDEHRSKEGNLVAKERFRATMSAVLSNRLTNSTDEAVQPVHNYSPLFEDNVSQHACKVFRRQGGQNCEQNPLPELHLTGSKFGELHTSAATSKDSDKHKCYASFDDSTASVDNKHSDLPLVRCSSDGKAKLDSSFQLSSFPGCLEDVHRVEDFNQEDEPCTPIFPYHHCKPVAIGPNHQAEIPPWRPHNSSGPLGRSNYSEGSASHSSSCSFLVEPMNADDNSERWLGTLVIQNLDYQSSVSEFRLLGRACCSCEDQGSIRCVRQHVKEAREGLKHNLGEEDIYQGMGFLDMGEDVAQEWSEKEEHVFLEVVFSNAASLGRNFWDYLRQAFPTRNSKELVSYYFNVFMLRKRAEQNRVDPLNVDSDDDEWQESNGDEYEEEYNSDMESLHHTVSVFNVNNDQMAGTSQGSDVTEAPKDCTADMANKDDIRYLSQGCRNGRDKDVKAHAEDQDNQDESCTTYEANHHGCPDMPDTQYYANRGHKSVCGEYKNGGVNDHGFDGGCDVRIWDAIASCVYGSNKDTDFSPTCDVIEVFGKEAMAEGQL